MRFDKRNLIAPLALALLLSPCTPAAEAKPSVRGETFEMSRPYPQGCFISDLSEPIRDALTGHVYRRDEAGETHKEDFRFDLLAPKNCNSGASGDPDQIFRINFEGHCMDAAEQERRDKQRAGTVKIFFNGGTSVREVKRAMSNITNNYGPDSYWPDDEPRIFWTAADRDAIGLFPMRYWRADLEGRIDVDLKEVPQPDYKRWVERNASGQVTAFMRCDQRPTTFFPHCNVWASFGVTGVDLRFPLFERDRWRTHMHNSLRTIACSIVGDSYPGLAPGTLERWRQGDFAE